MARRRRPRLAAGQNAQDESKLPLKGKHTRGIEKKQARGSRRSTRLTGSTQSPTQLSTPKRKREQEPLSADGPSQPTYKRPRTSYSSSQKTTIQEIVKVPEHNVDPIDYWRRKGTWPREVFDKDCDMSHLLARKKSTTSLRRKRSDVGSTAPSSTTPSDQKPRESKSAPYQHARYEDLLATKGSFMGKYEQGITDASKKINQSLLQRQQTLPKDTLFSDYLFEETCEAIRNRNEARVIRDISPLIVPSAENFAIRGYTSLRILIESINEGWNNSIPITTPRPQPDYSVGFKRSAFTEDQINKLQPFVGELTDTSYFMATYYMYFPFFASEVKCGAAALDVADRQNAHSMTLAVRGVVELFRLVKREKELHREIIAFSVSHDHRSVRIYGHYPIIDDKKTIFYRHPIHTFDFTALDGKEKWTAYKFIKNMYDVWMPIHFKRLCSVIDALPTDLNFDVSEGSDLQFSATSGLSQTLQSHHLSDAADDDVDLTPLDPQEVTPDTSVTRGSEQTTFKRPKKKRG